jgi:hypothetical protein
MNGKSKLHVIAHAGYRGDERPIVIILEEQRYNVIEIEDSWIASGLDPKTEITRGFVVRCEGGTRFRLSHGDESGWLGELLPGPRLVQ